MNLNSGRVLQNEVQGPLVIQVAVPERMAFLRKVYSLFGVALLVFAGTAWWATTSEAAQRIVLPIYSMGFLGWIILMGAMFLILRLTATKFPWNVVALMGFAVFEGFMTAPILMYVQVAEAGNAGNVIAQAGVLTGVVFGGLTFYTLTSKKDFSFLGAGLWTGFALVIGLSLLSMLFGWNLSQFGISVAMVVLMAGFVIYDTSNIMRRFPTNMAAAAAATLFLDVVIMFKHLLLLLSRRD